MQDFLWFDKEAFSDRTDTSSAPSCGEAAYGGVGWPGPPAPFGCIQRPLGECSWLIPGRQGGIKTFSRLVSDCCSTSLLFSAWILLVCGELGSVSVGQLSALKSSDLEWHFDRVKMPLTDIRLTSDCHNWGRWWNPPGRLGPTGLSHVLLSVSTQP